MRIPFVAGVMAVGVGMLSLSAAGPPVRCGIEMRNVLLRAGDGVALHIRLLDGEFVSRSPDRPPIFDDAGSYTVRLRSADIAMDAASINALMRRSLASHPAPISDVTVTLAAGAMQIKGKLRK